MTLFGRFEEVVWSWQPHESDLASGGVQKPVKVVFLNAVRVEKEDVGGADAGERLGNDRTDAAETDNPYSKAGQNGLACGPPCVECTAQAD